MNNKNLNSLLKEANELLDDIEKNIECMFAKAIASNNTHKN